MNMNHDAPGLALLTGRAFTAMEIVVASMHELAAAVMAGDHIVAEREAERVQRQIDDAKTSTAAIHFLTCGATVHDQHRPP